MKTIYRSSPETTEPSIVVEKPVDSRTAQNTITQLPCASPHPIDTASINQEGKPNNENVPNGNRLSEEERRLFVFHEKGIMGNMKPVLEIGERLMYIRDEKLYREECDSFEEYVTIVFQFTYSFANNLIKTYKMQNAIRTAIYNRVTSNSDVVCYRPRKSSWQLRELSRLKTKELRAEAWTMAVDAADGGNPTKRQIDAAITSLLQEKAAREQALGAAG